MSLVPGTLWFLTKNQQNSIISGPSSDKTIINKPLQSKLIGCTKNETGTIGKWSSAPESPRNTTGWISRSVSMFLCVRPTKTRVLRPKKNSYEDKKINSHNSSSCCERVGTRKKATKETRKNFSTFRYWQKKLLKEFSREVWTYFFKHKKLFVSFRMFL